MSSVCVRKMKALTVKMETVTLVGKGRYNLTYLVYQVDTINSKIFSLNISFSSGGSPWIRIVLYVGRSSSKVS